MIDGALLERAYGRGAHDRVPVEIIDLDDGTRLCEWDDGDAIDANRFSLMRRVRYASEADMWRELHKLAHTGGLPRTTLCRVYRSWFARDAKPTALADTLGDKVARQDAALDIASESHSAPGVDVNVEGGAREAWIDRDVALLAIEIDDEDLDLPFSFPRWTAVPGEADDRQLDTLGRRNGNAGRPRSGASRTLTV